MENFVDKLTHGDCLEVMPHIPDHSVDMVLCDLPYEVTARNKWDIMIPFEPLWKEYLRVTKDNAAIVLTATLPFAATAIMSKPELFRYDLVWGKNKSTGFLNAKRMPLRAHELILVFYQKCPVYHPQKTTGHKPVNSFTKHTSDGTNYGVTKRGLRGGGQTDRYPNSVINFSVVNNDAKDKAHPTQKPVELFEYLIKTYTDKGMVVLDNAIGSGTTAIASINLHRHWIGIEKSVGYYRKALARITAHREEISERLFQIP